MLSLKVIYIIFLFISPLGYISPYIVSYAIILFSWMILYPAFVHIFKIDASLSALSIMLFDGLMIGFVIHKNMIERSRKILDSKVYEEEEKTKGLSDEYDRLNDLENEVAKQEVSTVNLYEITKKMSGGLKFTEIFGIFSSLLKENFIFKKCDLLILNRSDMDLRVEDVYSVWREAIGRAKEPAEYDKLVKILSQNPKDIHILESDIDERTSAALPLSSENKMAAVLVIEDLPKADLEKFTILAMQFSLEIKKVLLYEMVERLAITDSLTGLYTRRYFSERFDEELQRARRYKFRFAFMMMDIDNFKQINDTYGHLVGDVILRDLGRIIKENTREIDLTARYGGEEFAVTLPETGIEGASLVAERIKRKVDDNIFRAYDERLKLTISIGIAVYPKDSTQGSGLIDGADAALYAAKRAGKNVVCVYKKEYNG